jgi:hypothetical protein
VFESPRGRQFPHSFDIHDIGTEIEKDRQVARFEDALFALYVHEPLLVAVETILSRK